MDFDNYGPHSRTIYTLEELSKWAEEDELKVSESSKPILTLVVNNR